MKNTKEITTGAMLLAIFGVVLLIDRYLSYLFSVIVPLAESIVIIIYGNKYGLKNGLIFSIAALLISFVITGDPRYIYFVSIGAVSANIFNFLLSKGANSFTLILSVMIVFSIAELFDILVLSSIFYKESFYQIIMNVINITNDLIIYVKSFIPPDTTNVLFLAVLNTIDVLSTYFLNEQTIGIMLIISCIITGIMEGIIIHLISAILFKRLKMNVKISFSQMIVLKPIVAYILFGLTCLLFLNRFYYHPVYTPIISSLSSISMFVLAYYGYIYLLIIYRIKYNKKNPLLIILLIVLLFPTSILILCIIGFLYGTGYLNKYLIVERKENE